MQIINYTVSANVYVILNLINKIGHMNKANKTRQYEYGLLTCLIGTLPCFEQILKNELCLPFHYCCLHIRLNFLNSLPTKCAKFNTYLKMDNFSQG